MSLLPNLLTSRHLKNLWDGLGVCLQSADKIHLAFTRVVELCGLFSPLHMRSGFRFEWACRCAWLRWKIQVLQVSKFLLDCLHAKKQRICERCGILVWKEDSRISWSIIMQHLPRVMDRSRSHIPYLFIYTSTAGAFFHYWCDQCKLRFTKITSCFPQLLNFKGHLSWTIVKNCLCNECITFFFCFVSH